MNAQNTPTHTAPAAHPPGPFMLFGCIPVHPAASAAPVLFAACEAAAALLTDGDAEPADADRVLAVLLAAIAKAKGQP